MWNSTVDKNKLNLAITLYNEQAYENCYRKIKPTADVQVKVYKLLVILYYPVKVCR